MKERLSRNQNNGKTNGILNHASTIYFGLQNIETGSSLSLRCIIGRLKIGGQEYAESIKT